MDSVFSRLKNGMRRRWVQRQNNQKTISLARTVAARASKPAGQPVIIMNASTRLQGVSLNAGFSLTTAWALRMAGIPVVHFACNAGLLPCVLGTNRDDPQIQPPCSLCTEQSRVLYTDADVRWFNFELSEDLKCELQALNLAECVTFQYQGLPLGELVLPSLRWILRRHHLEDDGPTLFLYRYYMLSAWSLAQQFEQLIDEVQPRAVLVFNGMFYPEATLRWVARRRGLPVISHEVGLRPYTGFFTTGDATAYPIQISDSFKLDEEQNQRLDEYLTQRFQGNFSMAGIRFWPEMKSLSTEFLERAGKFKQVVPVFTNVIFDTSQGQANVVFAHMFAWLDTLLDLIRRHPETFFVIRAHPDEGRPGKESLESVAQWVRRNRADQLENVLFVDPKEYFSSYELIQRSKFVFVYNSTIGLEASLMGAAVLCGGRARFTQLPTVFFPETPEAYVRMAEDFLSCDRVEVPAAFRNNARRFLYYQLYKSSLPFNDCLMDDGVWNGFVAFRPDLMKKISLDQNKTLSTIVHGILNGDEFLIDD
jgi:hypothetical protein